jgi:hypothetical protein
VEGGIPKVVRLNPSGAPDIEASGLFSGAGPANVSDAVVEPGSK